MSFFSFLEELRNSTAYADQIAHVRVIPPREASFAKLRTPLHPAVQAVLDNLGIDRLWTHQAQAVQAALDGQNVVVTASTASGKTLCYTLPIAHHIQERPTSRALLLFPTKALAQDQLRKLADFGAGETFTADTYDGDTAVNKRRRIKREAQVVLTNPDMLHMGILPYHHTWADFFRRLEYIVLDEVHVLRGVFGSHTANVLRRLRRIARHYGATPKFICCSATIGNPLELCENLTGEKFTLIDEDGSPAGARTFVIWNPPLIENRKDRRRSANLEAADLLVRLMREGIRSICFTLARRQAELILSYTRQSLEGSKLANRIMAYRGGYLPGERRQIEAKLFSGELLAVTSTTALEVGVDIGGLDAAILTGYPGSIASTWQQAGRAGRAGQESLAVLVAMEGGIHQYLVEHPDYLLGGEAEQVIIDPYNRYILAGHLLCAAYELAVTDRDREFFGSEMDAILQILADFGYIAKRTAWHWLDATVYPAADINIRSASGDGYQVRLQTQGEEERLLGTVDAASAFRVIHEGAVYLHAGETYLVKSLDLEDRIAIVEPAELDYYTVALSAGDLRTSETTGCHKLPCGIDAVTGDVLAKSMVIGYSRRRQITEQDLGQVPLNLPVTEFDSIGGWISLTPEAVQHLTEQGHDLMGSMHALEHSMIQLLPLFASCDPHDIAGVSASNHPDTNAPTIFIYDAIPGGVGIVETAYERIENLLSAVARHIEKCPCEEGCPACVQSPECGNSNMPMDKMGAVTLIKWLLSPQ